MKGNSTARPDLKTVGPQGRFPKVKMIEPSCHGYLILAAEVDQRPPFGYFLESGKKQQLLNRLNTACRNLSAVAGVLHATPFKALVAPPGRGEYLKSRPHVHIAKFDVVVLIETGSPAEAEQLQGQHLLREIAADMRHAGTHLEVFTASNVKRIAPVDHSRDGVFLFNFFYADDAGQNLAVWEYTAGWFQDQTGLNNSTVLRPGNSGQTDYTLINHCRWDRLRDVLPSLLFKRSFHDYVLANFEANRTAPMPILYKLA